MDSARTTPEQKEALYSGVSELLRDVLGKGPADTFVIFQEVALEEWGHSGLSVPAYRRASRPKG
ncbi:tautomerase family protein [Sphingobium sp. H39-3-25]|nr:tautomerase family protein [Sphingobium arseniciresistens]